MIRPQYFFRNSEKGLLAWDVRRLIRLSKDFPLKTISLSKIVELDENHWYSYDDAQPTCRSITEHLQLINSCDLSYPIILNQHGRVMDGMHRVCKALMNGAEDISAVQFQADPAPDYVGVDPEKLPYDEE